jgi:20S proteasome subunit beta 3
MSIFDYNGGTLVGMVGKDCVGIAADRRFGKQMLTLANDFQRVFKMQDNIIMGLSGLGTDIQTFSAHMEQKINLYTLKENKPMKPLTFCNLVAYSLFEKRYDHLYVDSEAGLSNLSSQESIKESLF